MNDDGLPICSYCTKPALISRSYEGNNLCKKHFLDSILRRVEKNINKHRMLRPHDRLAVAISGGKDSTVLLDVLNKIRKKRYKLDLVAVSIDEGIASYREEGLPLARELAEKLEVEWHSLSYKKLYGYDLDEIISLSGSRDVDLASQTLGDRGRVIERKRPPACSICGILRKKALNIISKEVGANKIVTGHTMDDEAQTVLLNLLKGDTSRFFRASLPTTPETIVSQDTRPDFFLPRIKPLRKTLSNEVTLYVYHCGHKFQNMPCPYRVEAFRLQILHFLNNMENRFPGTIHTIISSYDRIRQMRTEEDTIVYGPKSSNKPEKMTLSINEKMTIFRNCELCSEPTLHKICKACQIMEDIRRK